MISLMMDLQRVFDPGFGIAHHSRRPAGEITVARCLERSGLSWGDRFDQLRFAYDRSEFEARLLRHASLKLLKRCWHAQVEHALMYAP